MKKYSYILMFMTLLTSCDPPEWFCFDGYHYEYKARIQCTVHPVSSSYHVGDTISFTYFWPDNFTDSLTGINFSFNDQNLVRPELRIDYLENDSLYPGIGIDTMYDFLPVEGNYDVYYYWGYPYRPVTFSETDSGKILQFSLVFHTPGRYLQYMETTSEDEEREVQLNYCPGEIVTFQYRQNNPDNYSLAIPPPHPWELGPMYSDYMMFKNRAGYIINVVP